MFIVFNKIDKEDLKHNSKAVLGYWYGTRKGVLNGEKDFFK